VYIAFGEALGLYDPPDAFAYGLYDVHGAGAQRSDPKLDDGSGYPKSAGPQGDIVVVLNHVLCVRDDKGCHHVPIMTATITPTGTVSICSGSSQVLTANGGSGINYQWQKNSVNIAGATSQTYSAKKAADYRVVETNSFSCSSTSPVTTVYPPGITPATITPLGDLDICVAAL
jgi:hypothetical protein